MLAYPVLALVSPDVLSIFFILFAASFLLMLVPYWVIVSARTGASSNHTNYLIGIPIFVTF